MAFENTAQQAAVTASNIDRKTKWGEFVGMHDTCVGNLGQIAHRFAEQHLNLGMLCVVLPDRHPVFALERCATLSQAALQFSPTLIVIVTKLCFGDRSH